MGNYRTKDQLLHPEHFISNLHSDYIGGKLTQKRFLYRARVEAVDVVGGALEANPPNPPNSLRCRVYTHGFDYNTPRAALTIFHPLLPAHMSPPVSIGDHILVCFEDESFSNGMWISHVPVSSQINTSNPDVNTPPPPPTSANAFNGTEPNSPNTSNLDARYGGNTTSRANAQQQSSTFESGGSIWQNKKILIVGDSQAAGVLGRDLQRDLKNVKGASQVVRDGRERWGTTSWIEGRHNAIARGVPRSGPKINEILNVSPPFDIIIYMIGGNDARGLGSPGAEQSLKQRVERLWGLSASVSKRFWISPPWSAPDTTGKTIEEKRQRVREVIKQVVPQESYIETVDVTHITDHRTPDGLHFVGSAPQEWLNRVLNR